MMDGWTALTSENNRAQVVNEVLWALTLCQGSYHSRESGHVSISVAVTKDLCNESRECYILKVFTHQTSFASSELTAGFKITDFIRGLGTELCGLLSETTNSSSECWLQADASRYCLVPGTGGLCVTHHALPTAEIAGTKNSLQFYLKITSEKTTTDVIYLQKRLKQQLLRYKLTHPQMSLSLRLIVGGSDKSKCFEPLPSSSVIPIGDITISRVAEHYIPREELQGTKIVGVQVGEAINMTDFKDSLLAIRSQIVCLLFDCSQTVADGPTKNTIQLWNSLPASVMDANLSTEWIGKRAFRFITKVIHASYASPDSLIDVDLQAFSLSSSMPLASGEEKFMSDVSQLLRQILSLDRLGFKIQDVHLQPPSGPAAPDLTFTVSVSQRIPSALQQKEKILQTPFVLVLHIVWLPSKDGSIPGWSVIGTSSIEGFARYLQDNATDLRGRITQLVLSAMAEITAAPSSQESTKQRQKDEALKKAVPTVVDAITTILCNSTNHIFRRNCLAYAGASNTQEVAQFLTDSLTSITEPQVNIHSGGDLRQMCFEPADIQHSSDILPESDLTVRVQDLEEILDMDLLEAFEEHSSQELAPPIDGVEESSLPSMDLDLNAGLGQITEEVIKSLLEEEDIFEEQLLNSDWLNGEE